MGEGLEPYYGHKHNKFFHVTVLVMYLLGSSVHKIEVKISTYKCAYLATHCFSYDEVLWIVFLSNLSENLAWQKCILMKEKD